MSDGATIKTPAPITKLTPGHIRILVDVLAQAGYGGDVEWSETVGPPTDADDMALEIAYVILNSGMRNSVVDEWIWPRVKPALLKNGRVAKKECGHPGTRGAINEIWRTRAELYPDCLRVLELGPERTLEWCVALPWIGDITKHHLAKNFGVDVAKPDIWLQRVADLSGEDVQGLCERLAQGAGYRAATIDLIIWRACSAGVGLLDVHPTGLVLSERAAIMHPDGIHFMTGQNLQNHWNDAA